MANIQAIICSLQTSGKAPASAVSLKMLDSLAMKLRYNSDPKSEA